MGKGTGIPSWDTSELDRAAGILKAGGVVAYPTETFYGLGADATNEMAVERIFAIKGREPGKPIPILVADRSMLERVARAIPPAAERLIGIYWPGPLTLILEAAPGLPERLTAGTGTVGVRISPHPIAAALVGLLGRPLTATSANRSGGPSPSTAEEVARALGPAVDMVLDGGRLPGRLGSTVVVVTGTRPRVVRPGDLAVDCRSRVGCERAEQGRGPGRGSRPGGHERR